jgi:uncharacterized RDD family membrane protein YckC
MSDVTPSVASRWKRLSGALVDELIVLVIFVPMAFVAGVDSGGFTGEGLQRIFTGDGATAGRRAGLFVIGLIIFLALNGYLLVTRGQTIGKVAARTKIVDMSGNVPHFGKLLVLRYLVLGLMAQIPFIGLFVGGADVLFIFGEQRRCLHDYLAGTRVVDA